MFEISITRWSKFRTIIEVKALGRPIYVKEYPEDVADNPEVGVELIDFVDKNNIDLSVPVVMYDYRDVTEDRVRELSLSEMKEFTDEYTRAKGH